MRTYNSIEQTTPSTIQSLAIRTSQIIAEISVSAKKSNSLTRNGNLVITKRNLRLNLLKRNYNTFMLTTENTESLPHALSIMLINKYNIKVLNACNSSKRKAHIPRISFDNERLARTNTAK